MTLMPTFFKTASQAILFLLLAATSLVAQDEAQTSPNVTATRQQISLLQNEIQKLQAQEQNPGFWDATWQKIWPGYKTGQENRLQQLTGSLQQLQQRIQRPPTTAAGMDPYLRQIISALASSDFRLQGDLDNVLAHYNLKPDPQQIARILRDPSSFDISRLRQNGFNIDQRKIEELRSQLQQWGSNLAQGRTSPAQTVQGFSKILENATGSLQNGPSSQQTATWAGRWEEVKRTIANPDLIRQDLLQYLKMPPPQHEQNRPTEDSAP